MSHDWFLWIADVALDKTKISLLLLLFPISDHDMTQETQDNSESQEFSCQFPSGEIEENVREATIREDDEGQRISTAPNHVC